jgi:hypothetical protein
MYPTEDVDCDNHVKHYQQIYSLSFARSLLCYHHLQEQTTLNRDEIFNSGHILQLHSRNATARHLNIQFTPPRGYDVTAVWLQFDDALKKIPVLCIPRSWPVAD